MLSCPDRAFKRTAELAADEGLERRKAAPANIADVDPRYIGARKVPFVHNREDLAPTII